MCCCMPVMVQKVTPVDYARLPPSCRLVPSPLLLYIRGLVMILQLCHIGLRLSLVTENGLGFRTEGTAADRRYEDHV